MPLSPYHRHEASAIAIRHSAPLSTPQDCLAALTCSQSLVSVYCSLIRVALGVWVWAFGAACSRLQRVETRGQ